jgi:hypothetical protein
LIAIMTRKFLSIGARQSKTSSRIWKSHHSRSYQYFFLIKRYIQSQAHSLSATSSWSQVEGQHKPLASRCVDAWTLLIFKKIAKTAGFERALRQ